MTTVDKWKNGVLTVENLSAEKQAEHDSFNTPEKITERKLGWIKDIRLQKLQETDWWVLRGTMTDAQTQYRQKLRDIPADYDSSKYDELLAIDSNENLTHTVWSKP
jgi:hypothetical protein